MNAIGYFWTVKLCTMVEDTFISFYYGLDSNMTIDFNITQILNNIK